MVGINRNRRYGLSMLGWQMAVGNSGRLADTDEWVSLTCSWLVCKYETLTLSLQQSRIHAQRILSEISLSNADMVGAGWWLKSEF